jgi:hypothetical protein
VYDADPELGKRAREVSVKILADVQPVPPVGAFEDIEFVGMTLTPYVANTGRMAYSLRAAGMVAPAAAGAKTHHQAAA